MFRTAETLPPRRGSGGRKYEMTAGSMNSFSDVTYHKAWNSKETGPPIQGSLIDEIGPHE